MWAVLHLIVVAAIAATLSDPDKVHIQ